MPSGDLPEDVRAVGRQVREIAPSLRKAGIDIRTSRTGKRRPCGSAKSKTPVRNPLALLLKKKKRHVTNVT